MKIKTLKIRVKDKHISNLNKQARSVNFVWNYINQLSERAIRERRKFFSAFDLHEYTTGANRDLGLHSQTVQEINKEYVVRRKQFKKIKLSWRKSNGSHRNLGWVPFQAQSIKYKFGQIYFNGVHYKIWDSYGLNQYKFKAGCFNEDSRGRWYINIAVEVFQDQSSLGQEGVGIDLGLKSTATCSDAKKLEAGIYYRNLESKLKIAQRAKKKQRVRAIHAKIKNQRNDALHKFTSELVERCGEIYVGNISPQFLIKGKAAKAVLDCSWFKLKTMLKYKCDFAGIIFGEVNEAYTTQTCSSCGCISDNSPKGRTGLGIREWTCTECGATHDRDVNAAKNILAAGRRRLVEGISFS